MTNQDNSSEIETYVVERLDQNGYRIIMITEKLLNERLDEISDFVNTVILEHERNYNWETLGNDYFRNPLVEKFSYSYLIESKVNSEICFVNFSSLYDNVLHNHCTYSHKNHRGKNLAKYHLLLLCNSAVKNNIRSQEGYWPKKNNGSIILFLRMGWEIEEIRKNGTQLFMVCDNLKVRDRLRQMLEID
jgi:hypothetical protein